MAFTDSVGRVDDACLRTFGRDVAYTPEAGGPATVRAIFNPTQQTEGSAPGVYAVVFCREADLPAPPVRGDEVTVDDAVYKVYDIEADYGGGLVLRLRQHS
ncbi:MAG: hypothetical protein IT165_25270 [Bryobacterales bacterium]|nr:hypothetical protein [Bryobacterales bacterium]